MEKIKNYEKFLDDAIKGTASKSDLNKLKDKWGYLSHPSMKSRQYIAYGWLQEAKVESVIEVGCGNSVLANLVDGYIGVDPLVDPLWEPKGLIMRQKFSDALPRLQEKFKKPFALVFLGMDMHGDDKGFEEFLKLAKKASIVITDTPIEWESAIEQLEVLMNEMGEPSSKLYLDASENNMSGIPYTHRLMCSWF